MRRVWLASLTLCGLSACAFEPGVGVRTWVPAVDIDFIVDTGREAGEGWLKLNNDYQVRVDAGEWSQARLVLYETTNLAPSSGQSFDPADPPPGYSLCHAGHCHADDGRLVDYDEIEAELAAGGGQTVSELAAVTVPTIDLLQGLNGTLSCEMTTCALAEATITQIAVDGLVFTVSGAVRDSRATPRFDGERQFTYTTPAALSLVRRVQMDVGLDQPTTLATTAVVQAGPELFDSLDWADLAATEGPIELQGTDAGEAVSSRLAQLALELQSTSP